MKDLGLTAARWAVLFVTATVMTGCGSAVQTVGQTPGATPGDGGGGGSPRSEPADMCSLLTADEVEAAVGLSVAGTDTVGLPASQACRWNLDAGTNAEGVAFDRFVDLDVVGTAAVFDGAAQGGEPVTGIGDEAAIVDGGVVFVLGESTYGLSVTLHQTGDEDAAITAQEASAAQELATLAAGRL